MRLSIIAVDLLSFASGPVTTRRMSDAVAGAPTKGIATIKLIVVRDIDLPRGVSLPPEVALRHNGRCQPVDLGDD